MVTAEEVSQVSWTKRLLALALISTMGFGVTFCFDSPAALQTDLKEALNMTQTQFMGLYTAYSAPNVIMCIIGGFLVDVVLGKRTSAILFTFLVLAGQALLALGISVDALWLMYIARFVYGLGGESLITARSAFCIAWFKGSILNLAMGIALTVTRLGSTASINVLGPMYEYLLGQSQPGVDTEDLEPDLGVLGETMALAGISCVISFVAACLLFPMDKYWAPGANSSDDDSSSSSSAEISDEKKEVKKSNEPELTTWQFILDKLEYDIGAWFLFAVCLTYYCSIFPMISQGIEFFGRWWDIDEDQARHLTSAPYLISMCLVPFIGIAIDKTKKNVLWVMVSNLLTAFAFVLMLLQPVVNINPWISTSILSVGFSILACGLWPMVSFLVPERKVGTAYGVMQAIQNFGLALVGLATGAMVDSACPEERRECEPTGEPDSCVPCEGGGYQNVIILWLAFQCVAFVGIVLIWWRHGINCEPVTPLEPVAETDGVSNKAVEDDDL